MIDKKQRSFNFFLFVYVSFSLLVICFLMGLSTRAMVQRIDRIDGYLQHGNRYVLYDTLRNKTVIEETKLMGLYSPDSKIYCAFADYKDLKEKYDTDCHEYCHHLILSEPSCSADGKSCKDHFCG